MACCIRVHATCLAHANAYFAELEEDHALSMSHPSQTHQLIPHSVCLWQGAFGEREGGRDKAPTHLWKNMFPVGLAEARSEWGDLTGCFSCTRQYLDVALAGRLVSRTAISGSREGEKGGGEGMQSWTTVRPRGGRSSTGLLSYMPLRFGLEAWWD